MFSKSIFIPIFLVIAAIHFSYETGFADNLKKRRDTCGDLVKPHDDDDSSSSSSEEVTKKTTNEFEPSEATNESETTNGSETTETTNECETTETTNESETTETTNESETTETTNESETTETTNESETTDFTDGYTVNYDRYNCNLTDYFYQNCQQLSGTDYDLFIQWIESIKIKILSNKSLSADQKIVEISFSLKSFFTLNVEIKKKLSYLKLGDWGSFQDLIYVGVQIQIEVTTQIITLDGNDNCILFDTLKKMTNNDNSKWSKVEELISKMKVVLKNLAWSSTQQQAKIFDLIEEFFSVNSEWKDEFYSYYIEGYGSFESFVEVTKTYNKITNINEVIGGDVNECELIKALRNAALDESYTQEVRVQINQLNKTLSAFFLTNVDVSVRLSEFVQEYYQSCELSSYLFEIISQLQCGSWGSIYEIVFCSGICTNNNCGNIDDGPGTESPNNITTETAELSTETSQTELSTETSQTELSTETEVTESTTQSPADCKNINYLFEINISTNTTIFTSTIEAARLKWTASYRASFNSCWNIIRNYVWSGSSKNVIITGVTEQCKSFNKNNAEQQAIFYSTYITEWSGTIGQFVKCA